MSDNQDGLDVLKELELADYSVGVPEGYVLVPIEPTEKMLNLTLCLFFKEGYENYGLIRINTITGLTEVVVELTQIQLRDIYRAMLSAHLQDAITTTTERKQR